MQNRLSEALLNSTISKHPSTYKRRMECVTVSGGASASLVGSVPEWSEAAGAVSVEVVWRVCRISFFQAGGGARGGVECAYAGMSRVGGTKCTNQKCFIFASFFSFAK
jgi:hypothetical protein